MGLLQRVVARFGRGAAPVPVPPEPGAGATLPGEVPTGAHEFGRRASPENSVRYLYRSMWCDADLRAAILDIRDMDRRDPRVKKIHGRMARSAVKGGLRLSWAGKENSRIARRWADFSRRLGLHRQEKLESDARGLVMEGNLPLQWVLDEQGRVAAGVRMPAETILPLVDVNGRFKDPAVAYAQIDPHTGTRIAEFGLWQLSMVRLSPDSDDDQGALGRPYLDAARTPWRKLMMTEEDLVIRRRTRAAQRFAHVLEGATEADLQTYRTAVEADASKITTDFYMNRKGNVTALSGDTNLDQIADVAHLLDTFFAGAPAPKGLFGYAGDLARDVLEDMKRDYFEELDALQDTLSGAYRLGFRLDLLLAGMDPDAYDFDVVFAERNTETPSQRADRGLKLQALGVPPAMVWDVAGLDPAAVAAARAAQALETDPYPKPELIGNPAPVAPRVSITPGNAPKGESATTIGNGGS